MVSPPDLRQHLLDAHRLDCPGSDTYADLVDEHRAAHEYESRTDPVPSEGPACPHCGGGPVVDVLGSRVCRSCARVVSRS